METSTKLKNYVKPSIQVMKVQMQGILMSSGGTKGCNYKSGGHFCTSSRSVEDEIIIEDEE